MEVRSKTDKGINIRYSYHELEVLRDLVSISIPLFVNRYNNGEFADKSKGYNTTANKICNGWDILPKPELD